MINILPLHNFQILSNIFAHLDTHCAKLFRQVSNIWNTIGATVLGARIILQMKQGSHLHKFTTLEEIQKINPAVLRRISVKGTSDFNPFELPTSSWWCQIREIYLVMVPEIWPALVETLVAHGLPNLVRLALTKSRHDPAIPNFRPVLLRNLKVFEFYQNGYEMHKVDTNLQTIIDSAPNLTVLKIHAAFSTRFGKMCENA